MASVVAGKVWATGSTVTSSQNFTAFRSDAYASTHGGASNGTPFKVASFDVDSASAVPLNVTIPALGIVKFPIPVGKSKDFICVGSGGIATGNAVILDGEGGTATFSGGVTGG